MIAPVLLMGSGILFLFFSTRIAYELLRPFSAVFLYGTIDLTGHYTNLLDGAIEALKWVGILLFVWGLYQLHRMHVKEDFAAATRTRECAADNLSCPPDCDSSGR